MSIAKLRTVGWIEDDALKSNEKMTGSMWRHLKIQEQKSGKNLKDRHIACGSIVVHRAR